MEIKINREIRSYNETMFFWAVYTTVLFFACRYGSGRPAVFSLERQLQRGNRKLDVHFGCGSLCSYGLCNLPRHDRRAVHLGVDPVGTVGAQGAVCKAQQPIL